MKNSFFEKRICITGGNGFLGHHLTDFLRQSGSQSISIVRRSDYDLRRLESVEQLYRELQPEVIFHLAAVVGGIGANQNSPGQFFYDNLIMGLHMMEAARIYGVEKFVQVGTICAYPKFTPVPFKENDLWNGYPEETNAPYGIAKKALLIQGQAYREQYGLNSIYLLLTNLYGPGDNFNPETSHVIPALIVKFIDAVNHKKSSVEVWGTGNATREFLFVEDAVRGISMAAEKYNESEPVNIGTGYEISIKNLALMLADEIGFNGEIIWNTDKPDGQPRRSLDVSRALESFGFEASTDFLCGLRKTIKWYRNLLEAN